MTNAEDHSLRVPGWIWEWAKKKSGTVKPATFLRDTLAQSVIDDYERAAKYPKAQIDMPRGYEICLLDETCQYHMQHRVIEGRWVGTPKT